jgi:predicted NBD/HSP70 family sugar kinase
MDDPQPGLDSRPPQLRRGTNPSGVRLYNERLVLSLIRHHGALPKADIARSTGLSPPTVQVIVQALEADGLLLKQEAQRGRVGQPSVPLSLNPDGAFSFGVKIGRRSAEIVLIDFVGTVRQSVRETYLYPAPGAIVDFVREGCRALRKQLRGVDRTRIAGLGVATPFELWNWESEVGAASGAMQEWRDFDLQSTMEKACRLPVYLCNDATAACAAELLFGRAAHHLDILYVFVAWFIGGGLVLNGNLFPGRTGYAGSLGQILVPAEVEGKPSAEQLLHRASLYVLARRIKEGGGRVATIWESPDDWSALEPYLDLWLEQTAEGIAVAIVNSVAIAEFQTAVIDGAFPAAIRERLVALVELKFAKLERKGLPPFTIVEGSIGNSARAIGGASLPFLAKFMRDRELLFQEPRGEPTLGAPVHLSRPSAF